MHALTKDDRMWGMLCHIGGLIGVFFPPGNIIIPLVIWLIKKDQSWFVDDQGKEAVNFQISLTLYSIISAILIIVLIGLVLLGVLWLFGVIFSIIAAIKANEGVQYRYPLTIRFIK
jgi:uncharacterized Tic20 family protein